MSKPLSVAVLGATGAVGQRFVELLSDHPQFRLTRVCASAASAGKRYRDACRWRLTSAMPDAIGELEVFDTTPTADVNIAFSALGADVARDVEPRWAEKGVAVFSNASAYRMQADVALIVPEVNPDHFRLVPHQRERRGFPGSGVIVTNPNCSTTFLAMALAPLERRFGLVRVSVVTLQAISGAGYPGMSAMDIAGNVVPHIKGEEAKIESETRKVLGSFAEEGVTPADFIVSAQVNRVPVLDGHTEAISVELRDKPDEAELRKAFVEFRGEPQQRNLPTAPERPVVLLDGEDRPQPRLDLYRERAMATLVGRLRPCPVLHYKMTVLGHNTVRGAAGGSILNAELAVARGVIG